MRKKLTYKKAGVDIERGDKLVKKIKTLANTTFRPEVLTSIGGFAGLFAPNFRKYKTPVLVSATDGVGTKLKIAALLNKHKTMGIDLVAMCVNDLVASGAEPLFFLDYFATGKLNPNIAEEVIKGIVAGCKEAGCTLLGGETAEMPGFYKGGEYDLAGFAVGIVDKDSIIDGSKIKIGDKIIGLNANGLHSNGYSLVRKILSEEMISKKILGEALLKPTRIYVKPLQNLIKQYEIKGIAHITGGGLINNIPRILPEGTKATIIKSTWEIPPIFNLLQEKGEIEEKEMFRTFNMGIGMTIIVSPYEKEKVMFNLNKEIKSYLIGEIVEGNRTTEIV